jgi:hypothetical protein
LTVSEAGFSGKTNGELLSLAEQSGFEVLVTLDKGIAYQQNLGGRQIATLLIRARSNRLADLLHVAACKENLASARPGEILVIGSS